MTLAPLFLSLLIGQPVPPPAVAFDRLTVADARKLNGAEVVITFSPGCPAYTWEVSGALRTFTGPVELDDGLVRGVMLRGNQLGRLRDGKRMKAVGTVRVIHHKEAAVNGVLVPAWDEVRFEER